MSICISVNGAANFGAAAQWEQRPRKAPINAEVRTSLPRLLRDAFTWPSVRNSFLAVTELLNMRTLQSCNLYRAPGPVFEDACTRVLLTRILSGTRSAYHARIARYFRGSHGPDILLPSNSP
jgi:hypothetical protein